MWIDDPGLGTSQKIVDPLSLTLSLQNETDERVQLALEELKEHCPWQEARIFSGNSLLRARIDTSGPRLEGTAWGEIRAVRRIRAACTAAKIIPAVNFHGLPHTTASLLVEAGTPLAFVAELLGHSDTRMVSKHYAHLAPSIMHQTIRSNLPVFGVSLEGSMRRLRP